MSPEITATLCTVPLAFTAVVWFRAASRAARRRQIFRRLRNEPRLTQAERFSRHAMQISARWYALAYGIDAFLLAYRSRIQTQWTPAAARERAYRR